MDGRILDIALDAGFQSQEAFSRAFKAMFGLNPGECRKQGSKAMLLPAKPRITPQYINHLYGGITMKPIYKTLEAMLLVGVQGRFIASISEAPNNFKIISKLWREEFKPRRHEIKQLASDMNAGVMLPYAEEPKSHSEEMTYVACAPVSSATEIPQGMIKVDVPAGKYAVFTHKGPIENISHTVSYIYGSWLPGAKDEMRPAPHLELYDHRFTLGSPDSEMEICVPVK
jgi:AraC family transcriptional regulator